MYSIITDTSSNLPIEYLLSNMIDTVPFSYYVDWVERKNTDAKFDAESYYGELRSGFGVATTSVKVVDYIEIFEPHLKNGEDILYIGLSSGLSLSHKFAVAAAEDLSVKYPDRRICIVDSLGVSLGEGLIVMKAVCLRRKGKGLKECAAILNGMRHRICGFFAVDDLMYLARTGTVCAVSAAIASAMDFKPILKLNSNGSLVSCKNVCGRKNAINELCRQYELLARDTSVQTVCIAHAGCPDEAEKLMSKLKKIGAPKEFVIEPLEPISGAHLGSQTLALFFESSCGARR